MRNPHRADPAEAASPFPGHSARPDRAAADGAGAFAAVFRDAIQRRGLSLDRVRERLAAQGISVSLATLSYWQRGRSQPEQARSLRAVDALETILALPPGALRSLIGPSRPRGRSAGESNGLDASRQVYGEQSPVELALGPEFCQFNHDLVAVSVHETVRIDAHRHVRAVTVKEVVRATQDGARRITVVHTDVPTEFAAVTAHYGRLGPVRRLPHLRAVVAELDFGRPLARNETALIAYTLCTGPDLADALHHERRLRTSPREYLLHVCFHPDALPMACHRYFRERIDAPMRYTRRIALDVSHTSHVLLDKCPPGVHGMSWEWPR
ncbi:multiprotein-bridging factor 1 family protein [Streptomyces sp. NPDC058989]|uniref:helix-turn-helix domain-containing protein n=1 Tax=Streptomyces sp. NPDC058989 TaxID=3346686 RepID=UPI0036AD43E9